MSNVPKLRFREFSEEWEYKKLEDIFVELKDKVGNQNIETYSISAGIGFVSQKEKFGKDISGQQNEKYIVVKPNQFVYNKGNSKTFKYGCIYPNDTGKPIAVPHVFISFDLIDKDMSTQFFANIFENHYLDRGLRRIISSSARMDGLLNINKAYFFQLNIPVTSKQEQEQIASFLTSVDTKIEQLVRKEELLGQYKKGVMQKIFNQKIRFSPKGTSSQAHGEADDGSEFPEWEQKKLGEVFKFLRGSALSKSDLVPNGLTKCIHYGELFTTYKEKIFNVVSSTNLRDGQMSIIGDILMPSSDVTPQGLATASAIMENDVIIGGDTNILRPKYDINSLFISYFLNNNKKEIMKLVTGTTVKHIYNKDIAKLKIKLPCLNEQTKIANFLSSMDTKIEQVQNQLEQTKAFKKALLQQMFV